MAYEIAADPYDHGLKQDVIPFAKYYAEQQAHRQAVKEAFNNSLSTAANKLSPTGIDTREAIDPRTGKKISDIGDFHNAANAWQQYSIENQKVLSNPNNPNYLQAKLKQQELYQAPLDIAEKSKEKMKQYLANGVAGQKRTDLMDDTTRQKYDQSGLPVNHPQFQPFDNSVFFDAKATNPDEWIAKQQVQNKPVVNPAKTTYTPIGEGTFKQQEILTKENTPEQIRKMSENAAVDYKVDAGFKSMVNGLANKITSNVENTGDLSEFNKYNTAFKQVYGKDMTLSPTDHTDLAKAFALVHAPHAPVVENGKEIMDDKKKFDYEEAARQRNARSLKTFEHDLKGQDETKQGIWLDNYIDNTLIKGATKGNFFGMLADRVNLSPVETKALKKGDKEPDELTYDSDNGTFTPIYYQYNKDGSKVKNKETGTFEIDKDLSVPMSREQLKLSLLSTVPKTPQAAREMKKDPTIGVKHSTSSSSSSGGGTYVVDGKSYNIPADKVDAFLKAKPNAKKQ